MILSDENMEKSNVVVLSGSSFRPPISLNRIVIINLSTALFSLLLQNTKLQGYSAADTECNVNAITSARARNNGVSGVSNGAADSLIFLHALKWFLETKNYIKLVVRMVNDDLVGKTMALDANAHALDYNMDSHALTEQLRQTQELFISTINYFNKIALVPEGVHALLVRDESAKPIGGVEDEDASEVSSKCIVIQYVGNFLHYFMVCNHKLGFDLTKRVDARGTAVETDDMNSAEYYLYNIWKHVTGLFITLLSSSVSLSGSNAATVMVVEGCCFILRKYHHYVSFVFKTTNELLLKMRSNGDAIATATISPYLGQMLHLSSQFVQLLSIIISHLPCIDELVSASSGGKHTHASVFVADAPGTAGSGSGSVVGSGASNSYFKETSLFLIQWLNEFTVDVSHIAEVIISPHSSKTGM